MRVGIPLERAERERRVAAVPASVRLYTGWGWEVLVERGSGTAAGIPDAEYEQAGATITDGASSAHAADLILRVGPPQIEEIETMPEASTLVSFLEPFTATDLIAAVNERRITSLALEAVPRTTLAQSMDALSSQATVGGYAAALLAASSSPRFFPMMVTAAGTIPPARALVLGVGVAGLQAIATAKRLGAVVNAYDVRIETKEQVESLGARFVEAPTSEADEGGYATEVGDDVQRRQLEVLAPFVAESDILITTAQIPGVRAPLLVTKEMVAAMQPGSVVIDMAAATGGNVEGSIPDEVVDIEGVSVLGPTDLPSRVPSDASRMYSRNVQEIVDRMNDPDSGFRVDENDDVIGPTLITHAGEVVHPRTRDAMGLPENPA